MGLGGIDARQRRGALELIAQVTVEVGHPARVQVHHRDVPGVGPAGEVAAQHEGWKRRKGRQSPSAGGGEERDPHPGASLC